MPRILIFQKHLGGASFGGVEGCVYVYLISSLLHGITLPKTLAWKAPSECYRHQHLLRDLGLECLTPGNNSWKQPGSLAPCISSGASPCLGDCIGCNWEKKKKKSNHLFSPAPHLQGRLLSGINVFNLLIAPTARQYIEMTVVQNVPVWGFFVVVGGGGGRPLVAWEYSWLRQRVVVTTIINHTDFSQVV